VSLWEVFKDLMEAQIVLEVVVDSWEVLGGTGSLWKVVGWLGSLREEKQTSKIDLII